MVALVPEEELALAVELSDPFLSEFGVLRVVDVVEQCVQLFDILHALKTAGVVELGEAAEALLVIGTGLGKDKE